MPLYLLFSLFSSLLFACLAAVMINIQQRNPYNERHYFIIWMANPVVLISVLLLFNWSHSSEKILQLCWIFVILFVFLCSIFGMLIYKYDTKLRQKENQPIRAKKLILWLTSVSVSLIWTDLISCLVFAIPLV